METTTTPRILRNIVLNLAVHTHCITRPDPGPRPSPLLWLGGCGPGLVCRCVYVCGCVCVCDYFGIRHRVIRSRDLLFAHEQEISDDWESSREKSAYVADDML
ncbi:hypothetical protein ACP6JD_003878 [Aspergillus fumigatus]